MVAGQNRRAVRRDVVQAFGPRSPLLATYRGVPTGGKTLTTRGITWHQLDGDGKIARETTYWNDTPVLQELGLPIITPEYWVEGFDPASLAG